jgi:hypothetical protein
LFADGVHGGETLVELGGGLAVKFGVRVAFVGWGLSEDEVFCGGVLDGWVDWDLVSRREGVELFYVAVMTECVGPPSGVLEEQSQCTNGGQGAGYKVHAVAFEGAEKFPALFAGTETFFFFFCVRERGCVVVFGGDGTEVWQSTEEGCGIDFHDVMGFIVLGIRNL